MARKKRKKKAARKAPSGTITQGKAKKNDWQTPEHILEAVRTLDPNGVIALDPATAPDNPTGALRFCSPEQPRLTIGRLDPAFRANGGRWIGPNGLEQGWRAVVGDGLVFVNPPYGAEADGVAWWRKIAKEARRGCRIVHLIGVSRTEQEYATACMQEANVVCFVRGRVAFRNPATGDLVSGGCYASMLLGYNLAPWRFRRAFEGVAGTSGLQRRGKRSACFELRAL